MSEMETNASEVLDSLGDESSEEVVEEESLNLKDAVKDVLDGEPSEDETKEEPAIQELKKILKIKVDGKELEEEIDFNDEERLIKALQKEKAFDKRSQELSQNKKQMESFFKQLQDNPFAVLSEIGLDVDSLTEKHLEGLIEHAKKSPEQIAKEGMEKELKTLKEDKDKLSKEKEDATMEKLRNEQASQIETDIQVALDSSESILPNKNPWVLQKVASTMLLAMQNGYPQVTALDVIPLVEEEFKKDLKSMFDVFPEDTLENLVGKNNLDRLRKKRLKKRPSTKTAKQVVKGTSSKMSNDSEESDNKKSYKDFFSVVD